MVKEASLGGVRRARKWFVGVRQRPSGRWVAEIKDTIQKIRVWLGSYNTTEEAARAYDEAACLLCGANSRTNFLPSPGSGSGASSSPALPAKITNLLLQRLRARNSCSSRSNHPPSLLNPDFDEQPNHLVQERVAEFTQMQFTDFLNIPEEDSSHNNSDNNASGSIVTDDNYQSGRHELGSLDYQPLSGDCSLGEVLVEEGEEEEGINIGAIDFQFIDEFRQSGDCYYSPFEIAEEILVVDPMGLEADWDLDEPSVALRRMKYYERKLSASLYAFNGIPECLKLKLGPGNGEKCEQLTELRNACSRRRMDRSRSSRSPANTKKKLLAGIP